MLAIRLAVAIVLLATLTALSFTFNASGLPPEALSAVPRVADLQAKHGSAMDLTPTQTRVLYHTLIAEGEAHLQRLAEGGATPEQLSLACSLFRYRARIYARTRDKETSTWLLGLRDVYAHVLLRLNKWSVWDVIPCVWQHEDYACPGYNSLSLGQGKSHADILKSCWRTNPFYDKLLGKEDASSSPAA
jgi:hypothetical protein